MATRQVSKSATCQFLDEMLTLGCSLLVYCRGRQLPLNLLMKRQTVGATNGAVRHTSIVLLYHRSRSLISSVTLWKNLCIG